MLFYAFFLIFFIFSTSFPETYSARSRIFWLFVLEFCAERIIQQHSKSQRTLLLLSCGFLLIISIKKYKQYDRMSYDLLADFIYKIGNKALVALTPSSIPIKTLPSPLKEQCLNRLKKIPELPLELEHDGQKTWKMPYENHLSVIFKALSEKKLKRKYSDDII